MGRPLGRNEAGDGYETGHLRSVDRDFDVLRGPILQEKLVYAGHIHVVSTVAGGDEGDAFAVG